MISVILYGRNDSYGYNLHKRGAISFNCIAEVLSDPDDEIIFVDTNTPDDLPTFPEAIRDTLTPRAKKLLRILRVRPASYEKFKNGTRMKVLEPLCRNVGIRRANPRNRWVLNSNTDMIFVPTRPDQSLSEAVADLPDELYELPRFEMPEVLWESLDRANPRLIMEQFQHWGRRLHLNESVLGNRENVFDGPGDFQLAPRNQLFAIHGMNEQMVLGWHVDSNLCRRLFLLNGTTHSLLDRCHAFHCDHTRVNTMMHTAEGGTANDTRRFVYDVTSPYLPEQAAIWGMPDEPVEEIRLTDQQANRYRDVLQQLLPGLKEPMLQSALFAEAFNHGLLYDNHHVLPYVTDHLSQIPPAADVGYFGGNMALLKLMAQFRAGFGHTGRLLYDSAGMEAGGGQETANLPANCASLDIDTIYEKSFVLCLDLWMGNFATVKNCFGFSVPKPSEEATRFGALMMRRLQDLARREKARYDANPHQTRKFLLLGTQNTWFEGAATQLISVILTPYSSYVRHGVVRKDAFTRPFRPVPGHSLLLGEDPGSLRRMVEKHAGHPVRTFDFVTAWLHGQAVEHGLLRLDSNSAAKALKQCDTGRAVLRLSAKLAEIDGCLDIAAEMSQALECAEEDVVHPRETVSGPASPPSAPSARVLAGNPVIGVDIRPLCDPTASESFTARYTLLHLEHLVQARPDWIFQLYSESATPPLAIKALLARPNVMLKRYAEYRHGDVDLIHIVDPFHPQCGAAPSHSPLAQNVQATAMLFNLKCFQLNCEEVKLPEHLEVIQRLGQMFDPRFRLLTLSEFTRRELSDATGIAPDRTAAILSGVLPAENSKPITDNEIRAVRQKYGLKHRILLHVGPIDQGHNFETVVTAFGQLRSPDLDLVVVCEKNHSVKQVADFVQDRKVSHIIFPGHIPDAELRVLYGEAVALICLSPICDYSTPVLAAMAQGCPIVAAQDGCFPELCGDAALLFAPKDSKAISHGVAQLLNSPTLRRELVEKGRRRANQFTWEETARRTIAVWEEMLGVERSRFASGSAPHCLACPAPKSTFKGGYQAAAQPEPLVSAIVSAYNSTRFLRGCLEDLERQTIAERLEIIVVDSASPQDERSIVEEFQKRYSNIIYIRSQERETVYGAWNRGIKAARGKYVTNANTDDRRRHDALEILARTLDQNPDVSLVYADCFVTRTENETFEHAHVVSRFQWLDFNPADLLLKGCFVGPQPMWRREVHEEHGYFEASFISAGDYEFWLRLARTRKFLHVKEVLGLYLESPTSVEHSNRDHGVREVFEARRRHGPAIVPGFVAREPGPAPGADSKGRAPQKAVAITLPPCALAGHLGGARELLQAKKRAEAWSAVLAAIEARPFHPEAFLLLAEIARSAGDTVSARRCAQRARDLAPGWRPARKFLKATLPGNAKPAWLSFPECVAGGTRMRLSLCMIVRDEEAFLGQCLASVRGLVDQIVVVDTGSKDSTVEIAKAHGAEVYAFKWQDNFSAARNAALEHARGDWVLVLDADEELPPENHAALRKLMSEDAVMAWRLPIVDVGREDEGRSYVPRLFRNAPGLFFVGRVHEQVFTSIEVRRREWGLDNRLGDAALRHHGYRPEIVRDRNKVERNLRLLEQAIREMPGEPLLLMNYGLELVHSGQHEKALANYRRAFEAMSVQDPAVVAPETWEMLLSQYCGQLMRSGLFEEVVRVLTSPLATRGGLSASLHFTLGLAHLELKQSREAANQMRQCLDKRQQPGLASINKEILTAAPRHCLALSLAQIGETQAAAREFQAALRESSGSRPLRLDYARFLAANGQGAEAIKLLYTLAVEKPDDLPVWVEGGELALSKPEFLEVARNWTAEARRRAPQDPAILRQRAEALLLSGQCDAALPLWRQLQPGADSAAQAALVICEGVAGEPQSLSKPEQEPQLSREFLKWYRRLVACKARKALQELNARLEAWQNTLPTAAQALAAALAQAREAVPCLVAG